MKLELSEVELVHDVPSENLRTGDVAMLLFYQSGLVHPAAKEPPIVEMFNTISKSIAISMVPPYPWAAPP